MVKKRHVESRTIVSLRAWFGLKYRADVGAWIRIECGGKRTIAEASWLKREGQQAGTPDILIDVSRGTYPSLWLEVKSDKGKASKLQRDFISAAKERGRAAAVCYGRDDCERLIDSYMTGDWSDEGD